MARKHLSTLIIVLLLAAGAYLAMTPLAKYIISKSFTSISIDQRMNDYLRQSNYSLSLMHRADIVISIGPATLDRLFDKTISIAIEQISTKQVPGVGKIDVQHHTLAASLNPMATAIRGNLQLAIPDHEVTLTAYIDIRVFARFDQNQLVYVPALATVRILDFETQAIPWWPPGTLHVANQALSWSIDAINGAISEQREPIPQRALFEQKQELNFVVFNRTVAVKTPHIGEVAALMDRNGVTVIGELLSGTEERRASEATTDTSFKQYRNHLVAKAMTAVPNWIPGGNLAWISAAKIGNLVLDDSFTPTTASDMAPRVLGSVEASLNRITQPTILFSMDAESVTQALTADILRAEKDVSAPSAQKFRLNGVPHVALGKGVLEARIPIVVVGPDLEIEAVLSLVTGVTVAGSEIKLSAAFENVLFEGVRVLDREMRTWPVAAISQMAETFANSTLPLINGLMVDLPLRLPISPLVVAGGPAQSLQLTVGNRDIDLLPLMLREWSALIHPDGLTVVAEVLPYDEDAKTSEPTDTTDVAHFEDVMSLMKDKVAILDAGFDTSSTGFKVSNSMIREWLAPIAVPVDVNELHNNAIAQTHKALKAIRGPHIAASVPITLLRRISAAEIGKVTGRLRASGLTIDPEDVAMEFVMQAVELSFPFAYERDELMFEGHASGSIFAGYGTKGPVFQPVIHTLEVYNLGWRKGEYFDINALADSVALLSTQLVPIVNGAMDAIEVKIRDLDPMTVDFRKLAEEAKGVVVSPEEFSLPSPGIRQPVLLISNERVAIVADLHADYLSVTPVATAEVAARYGVSEAFSAYQSDFRQVWSRTFDWPDRVNVVSGDVATLRIAEAIENLWKRAGIGIEADLQHEDGSGRGPVAAIPPNPSCGSVCGKPSCDRNRTCSPRKECRNLSKVVAVPTTIVKNVCKPVTRTISAPITVTKEVCRNVTNWLGLSFLCEPISAIEYVQKEISELVCDTIEVVEHVHKEIAEQSCKTVVDAACIAALDECSAKWVAYKVCDAPFQICKGVLKVVREGLRPFDFDEFGYASTYIGASGRLEIDASSSVDVSDDLRNISIRPRIAGNVVVDAKIDFKPRASAFLACVPMEPLRLRNYRLKLDQQFPEVAARVELVSERIGIQPSNEVLISVAWKPITVSGQFQRAPLTELLIDTPSTLVTCPVVAGVAGALELLGGTSLTRDALESAVRKIAGGDKMAPRIARLLLDGKVVHDVKIPPASISIPPMVVEIGDEKLELVATFGERSIGFVAR